VDSRLQRKRSRFPLFTTPPDRRREHPGADSLHRARPDQNDRRNDTVHFPIRGCSTPPSLNKARAGFNHQKLRRHSNTTLERLPVGHRIRSVGLDAYGPWWEHNELKTFAIPPSVSTVPLPPSKTVAANTDRPLDQDLATFGTRLLGDSQAQPRVGADFVAQCSARWLRRHPGEVQGSDHLRRRRHQPFTAFLLG